MTETQKQLLRTVLEAALAEPPAGEETLASLFYDRLFTVAPGVRPLFHNRLSIQEEKFTQMLVMLHNSLDRLDHLVPTVWQSGRNHKLYGAESAHYEVVGEVLLWALGEKLGPESLTEEVRAAWNEFYNLLSLIMQEAAESG
ncbi:globin domain-containing protein [Armatimonas rosea]|uniref:Hemoglobin-like flavoprotein n=1 Tax=Armatimonas rosea TaxID=685828 RepID=A0A7W9W536_ARMRO|nr:globin domain-containing protein [Armatimonas rosea]MBB6050014.1 hemoglobin-like flavoprotein [Armatimonas rosea]